MSGKTRPYFISARHILLGTAALCLLAGCDETGRFDLRDVFTPKPAASAAPSATPAGESVERDVEAPEVFAATEPGLWDGRPSLGGVWVAHPDVTEPERVIIRNKSSDKFVVGALFRRERDIPGPRLQMSSDAAEALGVLAGAPTDLEVVALRKEIVALPAQDAIATPDPITQTSLEDPIIAAGAAIDAAAPTPAGTTVLPRSNLPDAAASRSSLDKPFVQIGIFSQEANANRAAKQMRGAGLIPTVTRQDLGGKPFWRVVVGPAQSAGERQKLLSIIKGEGFSDAFAVTS